MGPRFVRQPVAVRPMAGRPVRLARAVTAPVSRPAAPGRAYIPAGAAPAAAPGACQCFRSVPVSCASCMSSACPACGR
jgi:hypothetical protein